MPIQIVVVGKKHETWITEGIERYQERLKKPFQIEWVLLPHSALSDARARQEESRRILLRLNDADYVVLLDEQGGIIDSPDLSKRLLALLEKSRNVVLIIGGAYGVDGTVHQRANFIWSLSRLVFPHQLVRLLLAEQIYRAQEIASDNPYHHS